MISRECLFCVVYFSIMRSISWKVLPLVSGIANNTNNMPRREQIAKNSNNPYMPKTILSVEKYFSAINANVQFVTMHKVVANPLICKVIKGCFENRKASNRIEQSFIDHTFCGMISASTTNGIVPTPTVPMKTITEKQTKGSQLNDVRSYPSSWP